MTSNFDTSNALTVQDHYQIPAAVDNFDYDEPGASPIRGGNVKFDGGAYFVGKEKTLVEPERRFIVLDKASGWQFLEKDCPAEWVMQASGKPQPERPECGDQSEWPVGLDGKPSCPWKWTQFLYLMDADSGETLTFSTNSSGGKISIVRVRSRSNRCVLCVLALCRSWSCKAWPCRRNLARSRDRLRSSIGVSAPVGKRSILIRTCRLTTMRPTKLRWLSYATPRTRSKSF